MARAIVQLSDAVVSGIAAGEVIERPASVIKELVENALDAGAKRVEVTYDDRDVLRLAVTDDGHGIPAEQLQLAVARHATSKLTSLGDLGGLSSFGFRGEALASIAAVSRLELISRQADVDAAGRVLVDAGHTVEAGAAASRTGTRVLVEDLFAAVPARRKFLKSTAAEYAAAAEQVRRFALARPDVHFIVMRNGRKSINLPPVARLGDRLKQVLGREVGAQMVDVSARFDGMSLEGAITPAGVSFGSSRRLSLFVGGRWVNDRAVFRAVMEAYRTYLLKGRYPAAALFLEVPEAAVDFNVHPSKLAVRFADAQVVSRFIVEAVGDVLRGSAGPLGRWGLTDRDLGATEAFAKRPRASASAPIFPPKASATRPIARDGISTDEDLPGYRPMADSSAGIAEAAGDVTSGIVREEGAATAALPLGVAHTPGSLGILSVVGQVFAGYIVCEDGDELVIVDQHAAHERILFERLMADYDAGTIESQPLLIPQNVTVGGDGVDAVARVEAELGKLGWDVGVFGDEDVVVRSVPAIAAGGDAAALTEKLVADLVGCDLTTAGRRLAEQLFATVACHSAVRVGKRLESRAAETLLAEAGTVDFTASCPHGRPVARTMTRGQVERLFGR
jgi:DNA mismatch repair protein MutL